MRRVLAAILTFMILVSAAEEGNPVRAATGFADPAFQTRWATDEAVSPNFWGPIATAKAGQQEAYKESPSGQRTVQYFDKGRMESDGAGHVTIGLLTVELKSGRMQTGDSTFENKQPARVNMVGDPGSDNFTYADLSQLPENENSAMWKPYYFSDGKISIAQNWPDPRTPAKIPYTKISDPSGKYSEWVYGPFVDFIIGLPAPISLTTGYPISPAVWTKAKVRGETKDVIVQAFERRVLTYTVPFSNAPGTVEFGNIGQHYYTWRYGNQPQMMLTVDPKADFTPFAKSWGHHGYTLLVRSDGSGKEDYRTYVSCDDKGNSVSPCENPYTSYAGHTQIQFYSVQGQTASGRVLLSNDPAYPPQDITLTLKPYGLAELKRATGESLTLCGPDYDPLGPANVSMQSPCGA